MPLMKYYCDYCDKQFQDTPLARRRHLQGVLHQRAKSLWYNSLRHADHINNPEFFGKEGICNHFVRTGFCQYGDSCKYFHPNQNQNVQTVNAQGIAGRSFVDNVQSQRMPSSQPVGLANFPGDMFGDHMGTSLHNLPPSLRPPPEGGYPPLPFIDWG